MFENQVFSHGDVHTNNIMIEHGKLWLIDFEYAGITFRGWDFSLLMTESTIAYDEGQPFVYHPESNWDLDKEGEIATLVAYLGEDATKEQVAEFREEVKRCIVWGHFYWGVWSLVMIETTADAKEALDFYLPYAVFRFKRFFETYEEFLGKESILKHEKL